MGFHSKTVMKLWSARGTYSLTETEAYGGLVLLTFSSFWICKRWGMRSMDWIHLAQKNSC